MNKIKRRIVKTKEWTVNKACQAKDWCAEHKYDIIDTCVGIIVSGVAYKIGHGIGTLQQERKTYSWYSRYMAEYDRVEDAYNQGIIRGQLEARLNDVGIVLDSVPTGKQ